MRKNAPRPSNMMIKDLKSYFQNLLTRAYTTFIITPEGNFYDYEGDRIPAREFEKMFPIDVERAAGKRADGRNWND